MTEREHCDKDDVVVNRVDDAVVPDANPETGTPLDCFGTWRQDAARLGTSRPAQVSFHLGPRDIVAILCHRLAERSDIFGIFQRFEHSLVVLRTDNHCSALTAALDEHRFGLRAIDDS